MQIMKFTYRIPQQVVFSGLMLFIMRYRSLRSYCLENENNPYAILNFQRWITITDIPNDDEFRYCLQTVSTNSLNLLLKDYHQTIATAAR